MLKKIFQQLELSDLEAATYQQLLEQGPQLASTIVKTKKVSRQYTYDLLSKMEKSGLIEKTGDKRLTYRAHHPSILMQMAREKVQEKQEIVIDIESSLESLISTYHLSTEKPSILFFEGIGGIKALHEDIVRSKQTNYLFRSIYDNRSPEMDLEVDLHRRARVRAGINTQALTPVTDYAINNYFHKDKARLVKRCFVDDKLFKINAQINVYGHKVALVSLKNNVVVTIIENPDIAQTFKALFNMIWQLSQPYHHQIISKNKPTP